MSQNSPQKSTELAKLIALPISAISICLLSVMGWVIVSSNARSIRSSMESKVDSTVSFLTKASAPYIRNFDAYAVDGFAKEAVKDPDFDYIIFIRGNGTVLTEAYGPSRKHEVIEVVRPIMDGTQVLGQLRLGYNRDRIKKSVHEMVWIDIFTILCEQLFLFAGIYIVTRKHTAPLKRLVAILKQISGSGDYSVQVSKVYGVQSMAREIDNIVREFDSMLVEIKKRDDAIHVANAELESKVEQRTSELNAMLLKVQSTQQSLIENSKFSALGVMAGGIAHEVNNPLAVVVIASEMIQKYCQMEKADPRALIKLSENLDKSVKRISKIVLGLRKFSRDATGDPFQMESIENIIDDTLSFCQERFKSKGIEIELDRSAFDFQVHCRATEISQILVNLLNNGYDEIHALEERRWIRIEAFRNETTATIAIVNSGPRVQLEHQDKLFQPFFTTKPPGQGTGLGLSISKGIAETHGGTLKLDSSHPYTRFVLTIPLAAEPIKG